MYLQINTSISLATGYSGTGVVINTINAVPNMERGIVEGGLEAWIDLDSKRAGDQSSMLKNEDGQPFRSFVYQIPQGDIDTVVADKTDTRYEVIGQKFIEYIKTCLSGLLGIDVSDIETLYDE